MGYLSCDLFPFFREGLLRILCLTMFRRIRIRAGFAILYPYNTPLWFVNNTP